MEMGPELLAMSEASSSTERGARMRATRIGLSWVMSLTVFGPSAGAGPEQAASAPEAMPAANSRRVTSMRRCYTILFAAHFPVAERRCDRLGESARHRRLGHARPGFGPVPGDEHHLVLGAAHHIARNVVGDDPVASFP